MRVAIIGQGYVGLTIAVDAATVGNEVVGFDVNRGLVENLLQGKSHIEGISDELLAKKIKTLIKLPKSKDIDLQSFSEKNFLKKYMALARR